MNDIVINVYQVVGNDKCVEADDGVKVYEKIKLLLAEKKKIILSFINVEMLTSAFLNTAIGQLYKDFSEEDIKALITVKDLPPDDVVLLNRVVQNAKLYYKDPDRMEKSIQDILGE
ncbi:MAG: STAS-like domain-containing protein [Spirochaetia bacterium]|nr:STAS-like domain-containing protein [Spirochaetia bacterium]